MFTCVRLPIMTNILLVGFGGFIGSVLRYLASGYVQQATKSIDFPYGTLAVNVIGCFIIGFLAQLAEERGVFTSESRLFVLYGISRRLHHLLIVWK